ncbi:hypothetical protein DRV85_09960 [Rhodosalinus halophilus]|uniref:Uncharacterized protein n=1 Tax=Rhodosalinus halophilus TaxID=2259333 RepID=A0A365U857_9RHOB|nr:iron-containing alcohol dehydrogenase [Rhodosalinus halophilus]RBI84981.1 hypothetical protein DRV85_09960 [Rhodosalinus halophilus]
MSLITYLTRIHFADRVLEDALAEEVRRRRIRRPLLLTDPEAALGEALDRVSDALPLAAEPVLLVTTGAGAEAAEGDRRAAEGRLAEEGCDGLVAVGGVRPLDIARLIGRDGLPVIAVPTGAGSVGLGPLGAELGATGGRRQPVTPAAILCDATLTVEAGPASTAAAGMDALVHCLESYLGTTYNPPADGIALDGLRRAVRSIEAAVTDGRNLAARRELLAAALNAGLASQKGCGGIEAAARGLEAAAPAPHGTLHAALLRGMLAFNAPAVSHRFADLARMLDVPARCDVAEVLTDLAERIGLPLRLSEAGIAAPALAEAARRAAADPANRTNPRHATSRDYERIMSEAL